VHVNRIPNSENIMNRTLSALALAAALLGGLAPSADAQEPVSGGDDRAGTAAMEELLVPVTARTVALGNTLIGGLATANAVETVLSNPATITASTGTSALFSRTEYVADIGINYVGIAQRFGANSIALTLSSWDYGDIPRTTEDSPELNPDLTWSASTLVVGATYARQFTDRIAGGATLKGLSREIDNVNANGLAFDAGITYVVGESGLRFGVSLQNFGAGMDFSGTGLQEPIDTQGPDGTGTVGGEFEDLESELPSSLNFGGSYTRQFSGDLSASFLGSFRSNAYDLDNFAAGVEFGYANLFYVRGGVNFTTDMDLSAWEVWNVGAGLNLDLAGTGVMVDYAYRPSDVFGGVNMFTLGINL